MATKLAPTIRQRFFDSNGIQLSGGKLYSYIGNTSTPLATYVDSTGSTPNTNPVVLDSQGYCDLWLGAATYKLVLTDANDVAQWTVDNIAIDDTGTTTSPWVSHTILDGQAATNLIGQTIDFASYSSCLFDVEITRGTTVIANAPLAVQNLNGTARILLGLTLSSEVHGVTFSLSQVGLVAQLKAATSSGPGAGKIKLTRKLVPV